MDLFDREQQVYEKSLVHIEDVQKGAPFNFEFFETITKEYGTLLKYIRVVTKISDKTSVNLHKSNLDLTGKVHHDALTGIYNRRFLEEALKRYIRDLSRSNSLLSVFMLDIDHFKRYNDTYGHSEGDACLQNIAQTLLKCITREDDFVARYGGEEFVMILPHTDRHGAQLAADRVLEKIIALNIPHEKNDDIGHVTISIGFSTIAVKHTHSFADYIKCADEALYTSKQNGRNRYTYKEFKD